MFIKPKSSGKGEGGAKKKRKRKKAKNPNSMKWAQQAAFGSAEKHSGGWKKNTPKWGDSQEEYEAAKKKQLQELSKEMQAIEADIIFGKEHTKVE